MLLAPSNLVASVTAFILVAVAFACDRGTESELVPLTSPSEGPALAAPAFQERAFQDQAYQDREPEDSADGDASVLVWVNDVSIKSARVNRRLEQIERLYRHSRRPFDQATREAKRRHVTERLIDKELLRQYIVSSNVKVPDEEIEAVFAKNLNTVFGSEDALNRYLGERGMSLEDYRRQIGHTIGLDRLLENQIQAITISDGEIQELYERIGAHRPARERVEASVIVVRVPPGATPGTRELMHKKSREAIAPLKTRAEFEELARIMSQGPTAEKGGYIGWVERGVLPRNVDEIVFNATPGRATHPITTPLGFESYWIHNRRPAGVRPLDEVEDVIREHARRAHIDQARQALLEELRGKARIRYAGEAPSAAAIDRD